MTKHIWMIPVVLASPSIPAATIITSTVADGRNYALYQVDTPQTWVQARAFIESMEGAGADLVTITSSAENAVVLGLAQSQLIPGSRIWLGAFTESSVNPYQWASGEMFDYENFAPGEPNGIASTVVEMLVDTGQWNDTDPSTQRTAYVSESLATYDLTLLASVVAGGQRFDLYLSSTELSWLDARTAAENEGALLVTIRSLEENDRVQNLALSVMLPIGQDSLWLGASDDSGLGQFRWVSGAPFDYENFAAGEPNGPLALVGIQMLIDSGEWNDSLGTTRLLVTEREVSEDIFIDGFEDF